MQNFYINRIKNKEFCYKIEITIIELQKVFNILLKNIEIFI